MSHIFKEVDTATLASSLSGMPWIQALAAQSGWPSPVLAEYSFGSFVFHDGKYLLPCPRTSAPCQPCRQLSDALDRHEFVFACGVDRTRGLEVFVPDPDGDQRPSPLRMLAGGEPFGLFELLDRLTGRTPSSAWTVAAGARSWFFLNAMGDARITRGFNAKYKPRYPYPAKESDDWYRVLAVAREAPEWKVPVAFFPVPEDAKSEALVELFRFAWDQSAHLRDAASIAAPLRQALSKTGLKRAPQYLPALGYLLGTTRGNLPVMGPAAAHGDFHGPTTAIAEILGAFHPRHSFVHSLAPIHLPRDASSGFYSFTHPPHPSLLRPREAPAMIHSDWLALWHSARDEDVSIADCFGGSWSLEFVRAGRSMGAFDRAKAAPIVDAIATSAYSKKCGPNAMDKALEEAVTSPFFNACVVLRRR